MCKERLTEVKTIRRPFFLVAGGAKADAVVGRMTRFLEELVLDAEDDAALADCGTRFIVAVFEG